MAQVWADLHRPTGDCYAHEYGNAVADPDAVTTHHVFADGSVGLSYGTRRVVSTPARMAYAATMAAAQAGALRRNPWHRLRGTVRAFEAYAARMAAACPR